MQLPEEFINNTRQIMGDELFGRYQKSFEEKPPVSIRLNPMKTADLTVMAGSEAVPWCRGAFYLPCRPNFTMDPLLHAGCYYVQEAASMFLDEVLRQHLPDGPLMALDLCAAPGGKSTLMRAVLPENSMLYSNEPIRQRANILAENMTKWGHCGTIVTNNYPENYSESNLRFDVVLCDVPCSGEGMFRKDEATIHEWSPQNVERCWRLQRDIVSNAWACLNDGGLFIYSTCTFNTMENEENVRWMLSEFDANMLPVAIDPEWNITGSLLDGFNEPVFRFIPGVTRSEGLFMAVLRKGNKRKTVGGKCKVKTDKLRVISGDRMMEEAYAVDLSYTQAICFLRGEALTLPPDTPLGIVNVGFRGHLLGKVKNIGTRANNLYPKEWRIKTTHISSDYEAILRHT